MALLLPTPTMTNPKPAGTSPRTPVLFISLIGLFLLMAWDHSSLDLGMARWFGSATGFALENHWFWRGVLHDGLRPLPWLLELGLLLAIVKPVGALNQLTALRRTQLALTTLAALLMVSNIKLHSRTSCPSSLQEFGGMASYVSHWAWGIRDGGDGGCFPAGHASAGFAFLGGFFAFRQRLPATATRWLAGAMMAGLLLGVAQQVRGAHYMSHTFWTAWFCWVTAASLDRVFSQIERWTSQRLPRDPAPALDL
ncbi:MAG: phosphatase PAP2 family protein [Polaromonas sp.]|nr:phosphatase PAP2 family protein [Polaromonas sp.]MDP3752779.1 phosphatase PAP2 family protein [Polaromonas sp.]